jgi:enolase-phosphatase E1
MKAVVTDIEGTTSSIGFVKEVLFPYARRRLPDFVRQQALHPEVSKLLDETRALAGEPSADLEGVIRVLVRWIDEDRKATPLKELQGRIWAEGYAAGDYRGHIFPDAARALARWHAAGVALYVYSSGSVNAQRLLFAHSEAGDLTSLFTDFFDTRTGPKSDSASYSRIVARVGSAPRDIIFLSDNRAEIDAAAAAGLRTVLIDRDGGDASSVASFDHLDDLVLS